MIAADVASDLLRLWQRHPHRLALATDRVAARLLAMPDRWTPTLDAHQRVAGLLAVVAGRDRCPHCRYPANDTSIGAVCTNLWCPVATLREYRSDPDDYLDRYWRFRRAIADGDHREVGRLLAEDRRRQKDGT